MLMVNDPMNFSGSRISTALLVCGLVQCLVDFFLNFLQLRSTMVQYGEVSAGVPKTQGMSQK
jgi:hypothetical protein